MKEQIGEQIVNIRKNPFGKNNYTFYYINHGEPFCISHVHNENTIIYNVLTDQHEGGYFNQTFEEYCEFIQRFNQH